MRMTVSRIDTIETTIINNDSFKQSSNIKQTDQSFNWDKQLEKINVTKTSLLHNMEKLAKKRAVAAGSIFTSNMFAKTSFKAKVGQIWENIKLKFWDASKSISKDCAKLENLLTEGVTASIREGGSVTREIGDLKNEIDEFLQGTGNRPDSEELELQESYPRNYDQLSALKDRVETLYKFSEYADKLNDFHLPYEEENFNADDKKTQHDLAESLKQFYQTKNRFDAMFQSSSIKDEQLSSIKEACDAKRQDIEDRILGKHMVVNFYNTLDLDNLTDKELVQKCASAVKKMKSVETLLKNAEDILEKDSDTLGEYFKSRMLPAEVSEKYNALGLRLNRIAYPEDMKRAVKQHLKEVEQHLKRVEQAGKKRDDYIEDDDYFDYEGFYNRDPFAGEDLIQVAEEDQQEED